MLTRMAKLRFVISVAVALSAVLQPARAQALSLTVLDPEDLPNTNFSCIGKVIGGYYADVYTDCQMFHVCTLDEKGEIRDYKFRCIRGTVFDQETRVCERADEVDCSLSESFFHLNNDLYGPGIIPPTAVHRVSEGDTSGTTDFPTTTQTAFVYPETSFSCLDKIPGGLYADVETGCVVFHICSVGPDSSFNDNKFVCGEGTLFDQKSRTCQAAPAVDCSLSESLYYLNDRLKGPEKVVDLCLSQPLGTPLADLTSGCQNYMICESQAGGSIVERHYSCKKDYLFSQMRKRCLSSKKVNCVKETLSGILGLDSSMSGKSKRRITRSLLQHRLKRAALPPLVNIVTNVGLDEDARVRRALFSLAALQSWATENARDTAFIEVYTLNTKDSEYPKKSLGENTRLNLHGHLRRKKRNPEERGRNISPTSTVPVNIPPAETTQDDPIQTSSTKTSLFNQSAPTTVFPTKVSETLSTVTIRNNPPVTITLPPSTITITNTVTVNNPIPTSTQSYIEVSTTPPIPTNTAATAVITAGNTNDTKVILNVNETMVNSTPPTQGLSTSKETVELVTHVAPSPVESPTASNSSSNSTTQDQVNPVSVMPTNVNTTESPVPVTEGSMDTIEEPAPAEAEKNVPTPAEAENIVAGNTTSVTASSINSTTASSSVDISLPTTVQPPPENITTATPATTPRVETAITEAVVENKTAVVTTTAAVSTDVTTSLTTSNTTTESSSPASVNVSTTPTTPLPSNEMDTANNASVTPVPMPTSSTLKPITRENLPETNFTCKDKKLGHFYADTEANCQVFHYCSEGFQDTQILDLKFLCTGETMFNVSAGKCENKSMVRCGDEGPSPVGGGQGPTVPVSPTLPTTPALTSTVVTDSGTVTEAPVSTVPINGTTVTEAPVSTVPTMNETTVTEAPVSTVPTINGTIVTEVPVSTVSTINGTVTEAPVSTVPTKTGTTVTEAPVSTVPTTASLPVNTSSTANTTTIPTNPTNEINNATRNEPPIADPGHHNGTATSKPDTAHPEHHNWNAKTSNQTVNKTEGSISQPSEHPQVMSTTAVPITAEILTVEPDTEVSPVIKPVTADRIAVDEIETSTIESVTERTTEFLTEDYVEVATELGPELSSMEKFETKLEPVTTASSLPPPLTTTAPSQIISSSISPTALSNATLSSSVMNISSSEVSKNTNTETPL